MVVINTEIVDFPTILMIEIGIGRETQQASFITAGTNGIHHLNGFGMAHCIVALAVAHP